MMEPSTYGLRSLNLALARPIRIRFCSCYGVRIQSNLLFPHFRRKSESPLNLSLSLIRPSTFFNFNLNLKTPTITTSATHSSSNERGDGVSSWSNNSLSLSQVPQDKVLQVVLFSPQIPGNTGCIARTCAASAVGLHLIEPLGFQIDDNKLKRAGLDYWPYVVVKVHGSWAEFKDYFRQQAGEKRLLAFTKRGTAIHSDFSYKRGDWLVFGSETCGLPPEVLLDCSSESLGGGTIKIPMVETYVRCLNLSVSVGIALYEASRQLNYEQLQYLPEACADNPNSFVSEDIFA
ncbi:tRNA/rRNA methyltransferase [Cinnamomum micranthum f. kanehirae]|uniref:tRNA/rRNA methyltransferase n=1 Tax=Cinnamomum micranthum f. kanehirae TaxID=337451 RepID=A0A443N5K2_9MAGN|nr:tRNA/rRNA methyltransferase [Cinnamomum micranthum f. kanehirae]